MKKMIAFCLLLSVSSTIFSQTDTTAFNVMQTDYFKKSKNQKTVAWLMAGGGFVFMGIGTAIGLGDLENGLSNILTPDYTYHDHSTASSIFIITGVASFIGSIPLFISAKHNKHKAVSITFKNDIVPATQGNFIIKKPVQEVSLVFKF